MSNDSTFGVSLSLSPLQGGGDAGPTSVIISNLPQGVTDLEMRYLISSLSNPPSPQNLLSISVLGSLDDDSENWHCMVVCRGYEVARSLQAALDASTHTILVLPVGASEEVFPVAVPHTRTLSAQLVGSSDSPPVPEEEKEKPPSLSPTPELDAEAATSLLEALTAALHAQQMEDKPIRRDMDSRLAAPGQVLGQEGFGQSSSLALGGSLGLPILAGNPPVHAPHGMSLGSHGVAPSVASVTGPVKLFVGDIPPYVGAEHIKSVFNSFLAGRTAEKGLPLDTQPQVLDCAVIPGRGHSGQSCGFVMMPSLAEAVASIQALHRKPVLLPKLPGDPPNVEGEVVLAVRIAGKQSNPLAASLLVKSVPAFSGSSSGGGGGGSSPPLGSTPSPQPVLANLSGSPERGLRITSSPTLGLKEEGKLPIKLFLGGLPVNVTAQRIEGLFRDIGVHGTLVHFMAGRGKSGQACAFVLVNSLEEAQVSMQRLHNARAWWEENQTYTILSCRPAESRQHQGRGASGGPTQNLNPNIQGDRALLSLQSLSQGLVGQQVLQLNQQLSSLQSAQMASLANLATLASLDNFGGRASSGSGLQNLQGLQRAGQVVVPSSLLSSLHTDPSQEGNTGNV